MRWNKINGSSLGKQKASEEVWIHASKRSFKRLICLSRPKDFASLLTIGFDTVNTKSSMRTWLENSTAHWRTSCWQKIRCSKEKSIDIILTAKTVVPGRKATSRSVQRKCRFQTGSPDSNFLGLASTTTLTGAAVTSVSATGSEELPTSQSNGRFQAQTSMPKFTGQSR